MTAQAMGRRERKKQALRARIVMDCCTLIADCGVEGATLEALCEQVDISKKTFYNYFSSKDTLLLEICQSHLMAGIRASVDDALASGAPCGEQLDRILNAMFFEQATEAFSNQEEAARFDLELIDYLVSNFARNRGASIDLLDEMNGHFVRFFEHHRVALQPDCSPTFCGETTVGMVNSVMLNWMNHPEKLQTGRISELSAFIKRSMLNAGSY